MKLIIVLGILAVLILLVYLRMRPYIRMARQVFGVARDVGRVARSEPGPTPQTTGAGDRLVRCGSCGIWVPSSRSVKLRSSSTPYCSHACLEHAAETSKRRAG